MAKVLAAGLVKLGLKIERAEMSLLNFALEELRNVHGQLKIKELKLALDMATRSQLDFDAQTYQHFTILYLNQLMSAYKQWSSQTYTTLRPGIDRLTELEFPQQVPYIYRIKSDNQTRADIEQGLQDFKSGILSTHKYIPYEWYGQLCADGYIDEYVELPENKRFSELTDTDKGSLIKCQEVIFCFISTYRESNLYIKQSE